MLTSSRPTAPRRTTGAALALCAALAAGVHDAGAKKLYDYFDEHGHRQYSDRPPDAGAVIDGLQVRQLTVERPSLQLELLTRGGDAGKRHLLINRYHGPVELRLSLAAARNVSAEPPLPLRLLVPGAGEWPLLTLRQSAPDRPWDYELRARAMLGDSRARHRPTRPYQVPFPRGLRFPITQAFHGAATHTRPDTLYAVDIAMPVGTPVLAARDGVVMEVADDFFGAGRHRRYLQRANRIRILHDDGTMAVYAHLRLESARVAPGSRVTAGRHIADAGNSGYSTGPHLHFAVQRNADMTLQSVPFAFAGRAGRPLLPKAGRRLIAW